MRPRSCPLRQIWTVLQSERRAGPVGWPREMPSAGVSAPVQLAPLRQGRPSRRRGPRRASAITDSSVAPRVTASPAAAPTVAAEAINPVTPAAERRCRASTAPSASPAARPRRAARRRLATERLFADLASLAGIPAASYAVGEDVEGACAWFRRSMDSRSSTPLAAPGMSFRSSRPRNPPASTCSACWLPKRSGTAR